MMQKKRFQGLYHQQCPLHSRKLKGKSHENKGSKIIRPQSRAYKQCQQHYVYGTRTPTTFSDSEQKSDIDEQAKTDFTEIHFFKCKKEIHNISNLYGIKIAS